jgi:RHS repeat-associated protein
MLVLVFGPKLSQALAAPETPAPAPSSCTVAVRLDAVMVSSNKSLAGFPSLLPDPQAPEVFFTKHVETELSINNGCYICHERGRQVLSDYWEYDQATGEGPYRTLWSGSISYHSETNGIGAYDCTATRTAAEPLEWSDPGCGFAKPLPVDVVVSNRTSYAYTLVLAREEHGLAISPRGTARQDISELSRKTVEVFDPYRLVDFLAETSEAVNGAPFPAWSNARRNGWAERGGRNVITLVGEDRAEMNAALTKLKYRIAVHGPRDQRRTINWVERFTPNGGGPVVDTAFTEEITCTGREQFLVNAGGEFGRVVEPPDQVGRIEVLLLADWSCDDDLCSPGRGKVATGSIDLKISLGRTANGESAGFLILKEDDPAPDLSSPQRLQYFVNHDVEVLADGSQLRQLMAPQTLALVVPTPTGYEIRFHASAAGKDAQGYYVPSGQPEARWRIEQPKRDPTHLRVTQITGGAPIVNDFQWSDDDHGWTLVAGEFRVENRTVVEDQAGRRETLTIRGLDGELVHQEVRTWRRYDGPMGELLVSEQIGAGPSAAISTWEYYTDPADAARVGRIRALTRPGGWRETYEYDDAGRVRSLTSPFGEHMQGRTMEYSYTSEDSMDDRTLSTNVPRRIIERVLGQEISRTYRSLRGSTTLEVRCHRPGADFADLENLVTSTTLTAEAGAEGTVETVTNPDGTVRIRRQTTDRPGEPRHVTTLVGQPNASGSDVVAGTRTELALDRAGRAVSQQLADVSSGKVLARETYSYADAFGPPSRVAYLDGSELNATHDCCRPLSVLDRRGGAVSYTYDERGRVATITRAGITESYTYDAADRVRSTTRIGTNGSLRLVREVAYDLGGQQSQVTDGAGNVTQFMTTYPAQGGTVRTTVLPDGATLQETFAADGALQQIAGSAAHPVAYHYGVETVAGATQVYVEERKRTGNGQDTEEWTRTYYDSFGRPCRILRSDGGTRELAYNAAGQLKRERDFDGIITLYAYNARGELEYTAIDANSSNAIDLDGSDRVVRVVRDVTAAGQVTRMFVWPEAGVDQPVLALTREVSANGSQVRLSRFGLISSSETMAAGDGSEQQIDHAEDGTITTRTLFQGLLRTVERRGAGGERLGQTDFRYDAFGRMESSSDRESGVTTELEYDNADRIIQTQTRDGAATVALATRLAYDRAGRLAHILHPDGTTRTNEYTERGELRRILGKSVYPLEYTYDDQGRQVEQLARFAGGSAATRWDYDARSGALSARVFSDGSTLAFRYSSEDRLQTATSARGTISAYGYDAAGDLESILVSNVDDDVEFLDRDRLGRARRIRTKAGEESIAYHVSGAILSESLRGLTVTNVLDAAFRPVAVAIRGASHPEPLLEQTISYDGAGRVARVQMGPLGVSYLYAVNSSKRTRVSFESDGVLRQVETRSYDGLSRLARVGVGPGNAPGLVWDYQYDAAGRRTQVTQADSSSWRYDYDSIGQLISARHHWQDGTGVSGQQFACAWDLSGNRVLTSAPEPADAGRSTAHYLVNGLNQYGQRDVPGLLHIAGAAPAAAVVMANGRSTDRHESFFHAALPVSPAAGSVDQDVNVEAALANDRRSAQGRLFLPRSPEVFVHDADGNLMADGRWRMEWDAHNRLSSLQTAPDLPASLHQRIAMAYDHLGRRVEKTLWTWDEAAGEFRLQQQRRFVYDGWRLLAECNETNGLVRSYLWGADVSGSRDGAGGIGGLVGMIDHEAGRAFFYAIDGSGHVRALVDAADGSLAAVYDYDPFGNLLRASGPMAGKNPFRFSTKYQDDETGWLYFGERYYAPSVGRWLSRDPIGESGGLNLYGYAKNDPVNAIDPIGRDVIYLLDPNALSVAGHPSGHTGVLIGNDRTGWHYFSFSSGKCHFNPFGGNKADNMDYRGYRTLAAARRDPAMARYLKYARWTTSPAADRKAIDAVRPYFHRAYIICGQTCDDVAVEALWAAGVSCQDRWRPVDTFNSNKDNADESGTFYQPPPPPPR